jgi:hypothetical protein
MNTPNARFWAYINNGPVKLTLRQGQRFEHREGGATDEGFDVTYTAWEYPADELAVYREWARDARDCDGRMTHSGEDRCELADLQSGDLPYIPDGDPDAEAWAGVRWPAWERHRDHGYYDEFAQAAGY